VQSSLGDGEVAALGTTMTRLTAKALMYLVLAPTTHQLPSHTPLRRAGIDLIGLHHKVEEREPGFFVLSSDLGQLGEHFHGIAHENLRSRSFAIFLCVGGGEGGRPVSRFPVMGYSFHLARNDVDNLNYRNFKGL
jgi:hypothetical protein